MTFTSARASPEVESTVEGASLGCACIAFCDRIHDVTVPRVQREVSCGSHRHGTFERSQLKLAGGAEADANHEAPFAVLVVADAPIVLVKVEFSVQVHHVDSAARSVDTIFNVRVRRACTRRVRWNS